MKTELIISDFDGTLVDTQEANFQAYKTFQHFSHRRYVSSSIWNETKRVHAIYRYQ